MNTDLSVLKTFPLRKLLKRFPLPLLTFSPSRDSEKDSNFWNWALLDTIL